VRCLGVAGSTLWCLGYPAQALQRSQEALALAQTLAHPFSLAVAQYWVTSLHHRRHEPAACQAQADTLLTLATAQGFPLLVGLGTFLRGWAGLRSQGGAMLTGSSSATYGLSSLGGRGNAASTSTRHGILASRC
jgi:hypothetical protein